MATFINDSQGVNAPKPLDNKIGRFTAGSFRPYTNVAEVNSTILQAYRYIGLTVLVGTTSSYAEYWYSGGVADGNLVVKPVGGGGSATTDASQLTSGILPVARLGDGAILPSKLAQLSTPTTVNNNNKIAAWGDSLTFGTGGLVTAEYSGGIPWMVYFKSLTGFNFYNGGVGGETSTQIRGRMVAATDKYAWPTVIWAGANNPNLSTVLADVAAMVAALGHTRYLVVGLTGPNINPVGSGPHTNILAINSALASAYGVRYVNVRDPLIAAYNPALSQDVIDYNNNVIPTSLLYPSDNIHLNETGYRIVAAQIAAKVQYLYSDTGTDRTILNSGSVNTLFASPLGIGNTAPNSGRFTQLAVNSTLDDYNVIDGNAFTRAVVANFKGATRFLHPNPAGTPGSILIKPRFDNNGGAASMEISGGGSGWTTGKGIVFNEHTVSLNIGTDVAISTGLTVNSTAIGAGIVTGRIDGTTFTNVGQYNTAKRILDLENPGGSLNGGVKLPSLLTVQEPDISFGFKNEIFYNVDLDRWRVGHVHPSYPTAVQFRSLATLEDIPYLPSGSPGQFLRLSGSTPVWSDLTESVKLTGTTFGASGFSGFDYTKAFDGNLSTGYGGDADVNYVGIDAATPKKLTFVKIAPRPGLGDRVQGRKIQGSNTSTTTGYVDLLTIPTVPPDSVLTTYSVTTTESYRYFRIVGAFGQTMDVAEIEFYGYESVELSVSGGALALNTTTKVLSMPPATNSVDGYLTAADHTTFAAKQDALVSGTNIKTINGTSILGSGNITISGGGGGTVDSTITDGGTNPVEGNAIFDALALKANIAAPTLTGDVTLSTGDLIISTVGKGPIVKSPDGTSYRITVANGGAIVTTAI